VARLVGAEDDELLTVLFVGLAILVAGVAEELGVSDAIGALMVGLILGGTALKSRIEPLVRPLRDAFAAVFFFAFGLTVEPKDIAGVAGPVAAAVAATFIVNVVAGAIGARVYGLGREEAAATGLTLLGRGSSPDPGVARRHHRARSEDRPVRRALRAGAGRPRPAPGVAITATRPRAAGRCVPPPVTADRDDPASDP
jgi:hypothetical protein